LSISFHYSTYHSSIFSKSFHNLTSGDAISSYVTSGSTPFPKLVWPTGPQNSEVLIKPLTCRRRNTHTVMMKNPVIFWKPIIRFCFGNLYAVVFFM
jgi:hypothetical protein